MTPEYAAGFLDGEGCIRINRTVINEKPYYTLWVVIVNTYLPVLRELAAHYGGNVKPRVRQRSHHRPTFRWRICSLDAAEFLSDVLPHVRVKRQEAEIAVAFQLGMRKFGNRHYTTPANVVAEREAMFQEVRRLKTTEWAIQ